MSVKSYKSKIVASGNIIEFYEYEKPVLEGYSDTKKSSSGRSVSANEFEKEVNRKKVLSRARRDLRRLINSNVNMYAGFTSKFITLTFKENLKDFSSANYEFKKFKQRLEDYFDKKLKYVVVPEFQKRGAIHYHVIFFNIPFIRSNVLSKIWNNGFVKVNKIDNVDNVGAYICKYMTKDNDDDRLLGKKCYFSSRGLYKPIEIKEKEKINNIVSSLPEYCLTYANTFENDYNKTSYVQYNLNINKLSK